MRTTGEVKAWREAREARLRELEFAAKRKPA
jgi:hypothetical protein